MNMIGYELKNIIKEKKYMVAIDAINKNFKQAINMPEINILDKLLELLDCINELPETVYTVINNCIILDHILSYDRSYMVQYSECISTLNISLKTHSDSNWDLWNSAAIINLKIHEYRNAITYFNKAEKIIKSIICPNNKNEDEMIFFIENVDEYIHYFKLKIQTAYCHEYQHHFDDAIEILEGLRDSSIFTDIITDRDTEDITPENMTKLKEIKTEVYHALAHCYNESSVKNFTRDIYTDKANKNQERLMASQDYLLKLAGEREDKIPGTITSIGYLSCIGTIMGEFRNYDTSIKSLRESLEHERINEPKNKKLKYEIIFYMAYIYYLNGNIEASAEYFKKFYNEYCNEENDLDALALYHVFNTRLKLSDWDIGDVSKNELSEIHDMQFILNKYKPSIYVSSWIRDEWEKLSSILIAYKSIIYLKNYIGLNRRANQKDYECVYMLIDNVFQNMNNFSKKIHSKPLEMPTEVWSNFDKDYFVHLFSINHVLIPIIGHIVGIPKSLNLKYMKSYENVSDLYEENHNVETVIIDATLFNTEHQSLISDALQNDKIKNYLINLGSELGSKKNNRLQQDISIDYVELDERENELVVYTINVFDSLKLAFSLEALYLARKSLIRPEYVFVLSPILNVETYSYQKEDFMELVKYKKQNKNKFRVDNFKEQLFKIDARTKKYRITNPYYEFMNYLSKKYNEDYLIFLPNKENYKKYSLFVMNDSEIIEIKPFFNYKDLYDITKKLFQMCTFDEDKDCVFENENSCPDECRSGCFYGKTVTDNISDLATKFQSVPQVDFDYYKNNILIKKIDVRYGGYLIGFIDKKKKVDEKSYIKDLCKYVNDYSNLTSLENPSIDSGSINTKGIGKNIEFQFNGFKPLNKDIVVLDKYINKLYNIKKNASSKDFNEEEWQNLRVKIENLLPLEKKISSSKYFLCMQLGYELAGKPNEDFKNMRGFNLFINAYEKI